MSIAAKSSGIRQGVNKGAKLNPEKAQVESSRSQKCTTHLRNGSPITHPCGAAMWQKKGTG